MGHYTSEFVSRTLKFNLLKEYVLIHVDCTNMNYEFRKELFMASRDRLKQSEESQKTASTAWRNATKRSAQGHLQTPQGQWLL